MAVYTQYTCAYTYTLRHIVYNITLLWSSKSYNTELYWNTITYSIIILCIYIASLTNQLCNTRLRTQKIFYIRIVVYYNFPCICIEHTNIQVQNLLNKLFFLKTNFLSGKYWHCFHAMQLLNRWFKSRVKILFFPHIS